MVQILGRAKITKTTAIRSVNHQILSIAVPRTVQTSRTRHVFPAKSWRPGHLLALRSSLELMVGSVNSPLTSLFVLAIPFACIAWTVTHEELFRQPRDWCVARSRTCKRMLSRKFFYVVTCEYCFSRAIRREDRAKECAKGVVLRSVASAVLFGTSCTVPCR